MKILFYGFKLPNSKQIFLSELESRHCIKVLRHKIGDSVGVLDGKGSLYDCTILDDNFRQCVLDVNKVDFKEPNKYQVHIMVAPPKNSDRLDWLIEKSVEMGVNRVTFVKSEKSIRKKINLDRLNRISISAMKQCCGRYKVEIDGIVPINDFLDSINTRQLLIPHLKKGKRILIQNELKPKKDTCIAIGPEGDFTINEIDRAINKGFKPISLGSQRLRTETSVIMSIGVFNYVNGY